MLDLNILSEGDIPAISQSVGVFIAEAGGVCFEHHSHKKGNSLSVRGYRNSQYTLNWPLITSQSLAAWNDLDQATEYGAVAVAVLVAKAEIGYEILRQSRKGTGFDYWIGSASEEGFVEKAGLEISGILNGDDRTIKARVREKLNQTVQSDQSKLELYVIVVEFGRPIAEVQKK